MGLLSHVNDLLKVVLMGGGPRAEGGGPRDLQSGAAEKEVRRGQRHREVERPKGETEAET